MHGGEMFDAKTFADAISPYHATVGKFAEGVGHGSSGSEQLFSRFSAAIARLRAAVSQSVASVAAEDVLQRQPIAEHRLFAFAQHGPFQDDVSRARLRRFMCAEPPPSGFRLPSEARLRAASGIGQSVADCRRAAPPIPRPLTHAPGNDTSLARRTSAGLAEVAMGAIEVDAGKLAAKNGVLAKFTTKGAIIHGSPVEDPKLLSRHLRRIVLASALSAGFVIAFAPPSMAQSIGVPAATISGHHDAKSSDNFWAGAVQSILQDRAASQGATAGTNPYLKPAPVQGASTPHADGGLPPSLAGLMKAPVAPSPARAGGGLPPSASAPIGAHVAPVARAPVVAASLPTAGLSIFTPSNEFKDLAEATIGTNTDDFAHARQTLDKMIDTGLACRRSAGAGGRCVAQYAGVIMDFTTGSYTATLSAERADDGKPRLVAEESPRSGLQKNDKWAADFVGLMKDSYFERLRSENETTEPAEGVEPVDNAPLHAEPN